MPNPPCLSESHWLRVNTMIDRKSTRLNSSHSQISYAVFCLKKEHHSLQAAVHIVFIPEQLLQILHPLEVANSHASRMRKNVRNDHDPALMQREVVVASCRTL